MEINTLYVICLTHFTILGSRPRSKPVVQTWLSVLTAKQPKQWHPVSYKKRRQWIQMDTNVTPTTQFSKFLSYVASNHRTVYLFRQALMENHVDQFHYRYVEPCMLWELCCMKHSPYCDRFQIMLPPVWGLCKGDYCTTPSHHQWLNPWISQAQKNTET